MSFWEWLYSRQQFGIKLGLDNIATLLQRLGNPQQHMVCVHIAGTNGKGSVAATLAAIGQAAGLATGLYTSPHLEVFGERMQVDGCLPRASELLSCGQQVRQASAELPVTFFEAATAMALLLFAQRGVTMAVLETGMGGRLDATNVVDPVLTVLTPVSRDHEAYLGSDLAAIAAEKAATIKPKRPVVCAEQRPEVLEVIERQACACNSLALLQARDFAASVHAEGLNVYGPAYSLKGLACGLPGRHQQANAAVAVAAAQALALQGLPLGPTAIRRGVQGVRWPGRLEWPQPGILLDGAHNAAGARALAAYLRQQGVERVLWVWGMKMDKDPAGLWSALGPLTTRVLATVPAGEQGHEPTTLAQLAQRHGVPATVFGAPQEALHSAMEQQQDNEIVLVAGSLFLVGALRSLCYSVTAKKEMA